VGEFAVIALAAFRAAAVVNPLMPIFREHEFGYMLGFAKTKLLIVPKLFRGFDHVTMAPHDKQISKPCQSSKNRRWRKGDIGASNLNSSRWLDLGQTSP